MVNITLPGVMYSLSSIILSEIIPEKGEFIKVLFISSSIFFSWDFTLAIWASKLDCWDSKLIRISSWSALAFAKLKDAKLNFDFELKPLSISCFAEANSIS